MRFCKFRSATLVFVLFSLTRFEHASSAEGYAVTSADLRMMPTQCRALSPSNFAPDAVRYHDPSKTIRGAKHGQHWCHGYKFLARATRSASREKRTKNLKRAIGEFGYVIKHSKSTNPILADSYYRTGKAYRRLDNDAEAVRNYRKAIALKPTMSSAYAALSDYYKAQGDMSEAAAILRKGLKHRPKSKALLRRLEKIDGKQ